MKKRLSLLAVMAGMVWVSASGCSNNEIDTGKLRVAFSSLSGDAKDMMNQGLTAIDQSNYLAAERPLKYIAYKVKLDKNQAALLNETLTKVEAKAAKQK